MKSPTFRVFAVVLMALFAVFSLSAQTPTAAPPTAGTTQYFLAAGAGFDSTATPRVTSNLTFGTREDVMGGIYVYTTLKSSAVPSPVDPTKKTLSSQITAGVAKPLFEGRQGFSLYTLTAVGADSNATGTVGLALAGGGSLEYDISKISHVPGLGIYGSVQISKVSGSDVTPAFGFGFVKRF